MILKIEKDKYYGHKGKTKELFKKKYRGLKLKWMENVKIGDDVVDGWMNDDRTQYLLKLPEESNFKRFIGNSVGMIEFLKNHGAIEVKGNEKGTHVNYNDMMGFRTQEDRFGRFVGADMLNHYRVEEMLKEVQENFGIKWNEPKVDNIVKKKIVRKIRRIKK